MKRPGTGVWSRMHANGMLAVVHTLDKENRFAYGALQPGGHGSLGEIAGFEAAKKAADHASGCRQPCECKGWDK